MPIPPAKVNLDVAGKLCVSLRLKGSRPAATDLRRVSRLTARRRQAYVDSVHWGQQTVGCRKEPDGKPMARLDEASRRLQLAIENLEQVVSTRAAQANGGDDKALREALAAAQRENAALQEVAGTVSTRLDSAISRLRRLAG